jgi:hypothetical protein
MGGYYNPGLPGTIYPHRPVNCRRFQCVSGYHHGGGNLASHSHFLRNNPAVVRVLDGL